MTGSDDKDLRDFVLFAEKSNSLSSIEPLTEDEEDELVRILVAEANHDAVRRLTQERRRGDVSAFLSMSETKAIQMAFEDVYGKAVKHGVPYEVYARWRIQEGKKRISQFRGGKARAEKRSAMTRTIESMLKESPSLTAKEIWAEFIADGSPDNESMLCGLRERGEAHIKMVCVDKNPLHYEETGTGRSKKISLKTLENIVSNIKKSRSG